MRILAVHPLLRSERIAPRAGGMARVALRLTEGLLRAGHEVAILPIPERFASETELSLGEQQAAHVFPPMDLPARRDMPRLLAGMLRQPPLYLRWYDAWYRFCMASALRQAIRAFRPDIIHNHHATSPFPEIYAALGETAPAVLTHHHFETGVRMRAYRAVAFPSEFAKQTFGTTAGNKPAFQTVIYNPVDPAFSNRNGEPAERRKELIFIGGINPRKGIMLLLQAYQRSIPLREYSLTVFGDGALMEEAQAFASLHQLPVRFAGWQTPPVLRAALLTAAALVVPSRQESFGVVMAEALCCGAPVIGWGPTVRELETALQLPAGAPFESASQDAERLAAQILELAANSAFSGDWRKRMATRARDFFRLENYVAKNVALYEKVLG
jgi:glycosyltransferase involved in cell wall biosynthesis